MSRAQRAARNLLPLSREKSDLAVVLREETCELGDYPDIRWQFEIRNRFTDFRLLTGLECINRFGIKPTGKEVEPSSQVWAQQRPTSLSIACVN